MIFWNWDWATLCLKVSKADRLPNRLHINTFTYLQDFETSTKRFNVRTLSLNLKQLPLTRGKFDNIKVVWGASNQIPAKPEQSRGLDIKFYPSFNLTIGKGFYMVCQLNGCQLTNRNDYYAVQFGFEILKLSVSRKLSYLIALNSSWQKHECYSW